MGHGADGRGDDALPWMSIAGPRQSVPLSQKRMARNLHIQNKTPKVCPGGRRVVTRWSVEWASEAADVGTWGHAFQVWGG